VLGVLALLLVLLAMPWGVVTIDRARRRRSAVTPQERAEAAWTELRDRLGELQVRWPSSWTPRTVQRWLSAEWRMSPTASAALVRIVDDLERARYARPARLPSPMAERPEEEWPGGRERSVHLSRPMNERSEDVRSIERTVARTRPWWPRVKATAFPVATALRLFRGADPIPRDRVPQR
jgi:hypothetical protein